MSHPVHAPTFTPDDFLKVVDVCRLLRIGRGQLYRAVHDRRIPVMRFGRTLRFYKADILKFREGGVPL